MADTTGMEENLEILKLKQEIESLKQQNKFLDTSIKVKNQDLNELLLFNGTLKTGNLLLQEELESLNKIIDQLSNKAKELEDKFNSCSENKE